jgi:hypothetical protein
MFNIDATALPFAQALWLAPLACALHVGEEWPQFVPWAHRFASLRFTRREYLLIPISGFASFVGVALLFAFLSSPPLVFLFFAFLLLPAPLWNIGFHVGATVKYRAYCPGVITAALLYPPVIYLLTQSAWREGLLSASAWVAAVLIAGVFHFWEVGHDVFKAW